MNFFNVFFLCYRELVGPNWKVLRGLGMRRILAEGYTWRGVLVVPCMFRYLIPVCLLAKDGPFLGLGLSCYMPMWLIDTHYKFSLLFQLVLGVCSVMVASLFDVSYRLRFPLTS